MNAKILLAFLFCLIVVALAAPAPGGGGKGGDGGGIRKKVVHHHWVTKKIPKTVYYTKVIPRHIPVPYYVPVGGSSSSGSGGDTQVITGGQGGYNS